ncbi:MAG TPA: FHA domain-containing protein [Solirubrobacteraceae bacterium]|nr:FHA domain-containing protein [Solirubrobacteraceae bacterium]
MDSLTSGTFVGAGSFRCARCDYALTLNGSDVLSDCPRCGSREFVRASLFSTERIPAGPRAAGEPAGDGGLVLSPSPELDARLARARERIDQPGEYLCYEEGGELRTVALTREWTRIGRSLAADVRFDDPTVSRRHALIVRHPDGVRLLDDRSLNGVFVNGSRVDGKVLKDGDEIIVGRYRLAFLTVPPSPDALDARPQASSLDPVG